MTEAEIYAAIGEEGFEKLVREFYYQVPKDSILGPMYPAEDLADAEQRLCSFLVGRFGGPMRYVEQRGHPRLRMRHARFFIDAAASGRWMELMRRAMDVTELPVEVRQVLEPYFEQTAAGMVNRVQAGE